MTVVAKQNEPGAGIAISRPFRRFRLSVAMIEDVARLSDGALVIGAGVATYALHQGVGEASALTPMVLVLGTGMTGVALQQAINGCSFPVIRSPHRLAGPAALAWLGLFTVLGLVQAVLTIKPTVMSGWLAVWAAAAVALLIVERGVLALLVNHLCRQGYLRRRTVVVGGEPYVEPLLAALAAQSSAELEVIGRFDDRSDDRSPRLASLCPKLGTIDDLVGFARTTRVDLVLVAIPISAEDRLLTMLRKLWVLPVDIRLAAHMASLRFRARAYSFIGAVPVLDVVDRPVRDWDAIAKSLFDQIVGLFCLAVAAPVMLAVALAIKLDSRGPILFRQQRYGFNNEPVEVYKFRSLYVDQLDFSASRAVTRGDPRVTRVGRWIRKTSLDELPQLFNVVFKGDMSLVGPRPHALRGSAENRLYDDVVDGYFARHRVIPGITGWAQINGWRGETDTAEKIQKRVECDLHYIENWSIGLDLYILVATLFAVFRQQDAY